MSETREGSNIPWPCSEDELKRLRTLKENKRVHWGDGFNELYRRELLGLPPPRPVKLILADDEMMTEEVVRARTRGHPNPQLTIVERERLSVLRGTSKTAADHDNDGLVDVFIVDLLTYHRLSSWVLKTHGLCLRSSGVVVEYDSMHLNVVAPLPKIDYVWHGLRVMDADTDANANAKREGSNEWSERKQKNSNQE